MDTEKELSSSARIFYPKFNKEELIEKIKKKRKALSKEFSLSLVVLFGSYAQGNYTVASDVDLLVIYKGKERKDAFAKVKKTMDIPLLEPHVYTENDYKRLKRTIDRMKEKGIVLFSSK